MSATNEPEIHGTCDASFARVRDEFARGFGELVGDDERGEIGAAIAVTVESTPVVDLWAASPTPAGGARGDAIRSPTCSPRPRVSWRSLRCA